MTSLWELCRLNNNVGFWVVYLPLAWSVALVYHANPDIHVLHALHRLVLYVPLSFLLKSIIMTIDDILDADIDARVQRTKHRPIPRRAISLLHASLFFLFLLAITIPFAFLLLQPVALRISMCVWPLYIIYPTCKRWTNLAPIPLGLMFNIGIFMGWPDLSPDTSIPWTTLIPIYIAACFWTFTYETIYQHQDKLDDLKIGIYSPALLLGKYTISCTIFTALAFLSLLAYGASLNHHGPLFYIALTPAASLLLPPLLRINLDDPNDCYLFFLRTPRVGQFILAAFLLDAFHHRFANGIPL